MQRQHTPLALAAFLAFAAVATTSLVLTLSRDANAGAGFSDTPPWIAAHAAWLQDNGIADGFGDGTFGPNKNITRGQAAYWFGNYNNALEVVPNSANLTNPIVGGGTFRRTATCPAGKRPVAGGGTTANESAFSIRASIPDSNGWAVEWASDDGTDQVPGQTDVWALCAPETLTG